MIVPAAVAALIFFSGCVIYEPAPLRPPPPRPGDLPPPAAKGPVYAPGYYVSVLTPGYRRIYHYGRPCFAHGPNFYRLYRGGYRIVPPPC